MRSKIPNAGSENDKKLLSYQLYLTAEHHSHECECVNLLISLVCNDLGTISIYERNMSNGTCHKVTCLVQTLFQHVEHERRTQKDFGLRTMRDVPYQLFMSSEETPENRCDSWIGTSGYDEAGYCCQ